MFEKMFSSPSNLDEWKEKNNGPKREAGNIASGRTDEDIVREKKKMIAKNKELREIVYSRNFEGAEKITRKDFLISVGALAGILIAKKYGNVEKALSILAGEKDTAAIVHNAESKKEAEKINPETAEPKKEQVGEKVKEANTNVLKNYESSVHKKEKIEFNLDRPVRVGIEDYNSAKEYWRQEYKNGELRPDLDNALERMRPYLNDLKTIFRDLGEYEDLVYVAIPESSGIKGKRSPAGAVGLYQLLPKTAKKWGVKKGLLKNPLKNAMAATKNFKQLLHVSKDRNIALSGHNIGKMWEYPKLGKNNSSYKDYLAFMSEEGEKTRKQIENDDYILRKIGKKDTLSKLARLYKIDKDDLKSANNIKNDSIKVTEIIKIPLVNREQREHVFQMEIAGYKENFNFVPRVNAVIEVIKEEKLA
jgi:hypothetical protein